MILYGQSCRFLCSFIVYFSKRKILPCSLNLKGSTWFTDKLAAILSKKENGFHMWVEVFELDFPLDGQSRQARSPLAIGQFAKPLMKPVR